MENNIKFYTNETTKTEDGRVTDTSTFSFNNDQILDMMMSKIDHEPPFIEEDECSLGECRDNEFQLVNFRIPMYYYTLGEKLVEKGVLDKSFFKIESFSKKNEYGEYETYCKPYTDMIDSSYLHPISDYLLGKGWILTKEKDRDDYKPIVSAFAHIDNDHIVNVAFRRGGKYGKELQIRLQPMKGKDSLTWHHIDTMLRDKVLAAIAFPFQAYLAESISCGATHKIEWYQSNTCRVYFYPTEYTRLLIKKRTPGCSMCFYSNGIFESPLNSNIEGDAWMPFYEFLQIMVGIKNSTNEEITDMRNSCMTVSSPYKISYWNPSETKMFGEDSDGYNGSSTLVPRGCCGVQHQYGESKNLPEPDEMSDPIFAILGCPEHEDKISLLSEIETFLEKESEK